MLSQTCINFCLVLNTKEDILKNVGNQTVAGPHWFWYYRKKSYGSQWTSNCLVFHVLQNSIYVQQKKETHSGLKQLLSKLWYKNKTLWQNWQTDDRFFFFWVNYSFNINKTTKHKEKNHSLLFALESVYIIFYFYVLSISWMLLLNTIVPENKALFVYYVYLEWMNEWMYLCSYFLTRKIK